MAITGAMLIGADEVFGAKGTIRAVNPESGEELEPAFGGGTSADVERACTLAAQDFDAFRSAPLEVRAQLLEAIADHLMEFGEELIERSMAESGLTRQRMEGERGRTCFQLRYLASLVREGRFRNVTVNTARPERKPYPRPDLRSRTIPLGPVAVFGASTFPLAFSVAGVDTAAAFAAGCTVVAKSHPSHPATSELAGRAIRQSIAKLGLPAGAFSLVTGAGNQIGEALVQHPAIQAVAFIGSRTGGNALMALAAARPHPIPVFAEMSSINPIFLLPGALNARGASIAAGLVASVTLGIGQFCTRPGLVFGVAGEAFDAFSKSAAKAIEASEAATMVNRPIHDAFAHSVQSLSHLAGVTRLAEGGAPQHGTAAQPVLFLTTGAMFAANPRLAEDVCGPAALLIACEDEEQMIHLANGLAGQLTATLHLEDADHALATRLLPILERKAGRLVVNGFSTGVEVVDAMVHGGPSPSTSDARITSIGSAAIDRFLRPVCYQSFPSSLLPEELQDEHLAEQTRLVDGTLFTA